jgi:hypothetical protein
VEATFGIYEQWLLKVSGSTRRTAASTAARFQGYSSGIMLRRRF